MRALGLVPTYPSGEVSNLGRGFWEMVLARSTSHGKLRGLLNNWLPDPNSHGGGHNKSSTNLQAKQVVDEPDEWRRVKEVDGRGEHGEERTQSTRESSSVDQGRSSEHTHGHDSPSCNSCTRTVSGAETAPTGDGLSPPRNDLDVPPTPTTEEVIRLAAARHAEPSAEAELLVECVDAATPRLRTCAECDESIVGAVFMLHDAPYCCQRHRLAAYHKAEKRKALDGPDVAPIAPCSSGTGLAARFGTW